MCCALPSVAIERNDREGSKIFEMHKITGSSLIPIKKKKQYSIPQTHMCRRLILVYYIFNI